MTLPKRDGLAMLGVTGAVAIAVTGGVGLLQTAQAQTELGPPDNPRGEPTQQTPVPQLTAAEAKAARAVLAADPRVAALRRGRASQVIGPGVWHSGTTKLGAFFSIQFTPAASFDQATVPVIPFDRGLNRNADARRSSLQRFSAEGVWALDVSVDLASRRVVRVSPWGRITQPAPAWTTGPVQNSD